jgi:hypothetical protein
LSITLSLTRLAQQSTTAQFGRGWLVAATPPPILCYISCLGSLRVLLLSHTHFLGVDSVFYPNPTVGVRLQFAVHAFQLFLVDSICQVSSLNYSPGGGGNHVWCELLTCWVCCFMQAALKPACREKRYAAFFKALLGTGFSGAGRRQAFHSFGSRMLQSSMLLDALSSAY